MRIPELLSSITMRFPADHQEILADSTLFLVTEQVRRAIWGQEFPPYRRVLVSEIAKEIR